MSGRQVGTIVGQVVGAYFGPVGSAIGGVIGGAIGGSFDPDIINQGPRLTDLKIQSSSYGNAVPIIYGTVRVAGNVIWSTDIRETAVQTEADAKGGPAVIQEDFSYDMDCAIAISEGEMAGISRIYANGILIFDVAFGSSPQNIFASGQWATSTILYKGTETQLPDPTMEAAIGVGNCSAHRGTCYLVIAGLQLNVLKTSTIPNFEFVISQNADVQQYLRKIVADITPVGSPRVVMDDSLIRVSNYGGDILTRVYDLNGNFVSIEPRSEFENILPALAGSPYGAWAMFDDTQVRFTIGGPNAYEVTGITVGPIQVTTLLPAGRSLTAFSIGVDGRHIVTIDRDASALLDPSNYANVWTMFVWDGADLTIESTGTIDTTTVQYTAEFGAPSSFYHYHASMMESDNKTIWSAYGAGTAWLDVLQIGADGVMRRLYLFQSNGYDGIEPAGEFSYPSVYADNGVAVVVATNKLMIFTREEEIDPGSETLEYVVTDLCTRAGIPALELDCTDLDAEVEGFVVGTSMTARAAIEPLRTGYFFDAVDGDKLKFIERGGAVSATFDYEDLGAGMNEPSPLLIESVRAQETELPSRVNIKYLSVAADYQIGAQSARRETTQSRETLEFAMPIVFDDDRAAQIADIVMRQIWAGRTTRSWSSTTEYAVNEPTDVATLDDGNVVRQVRTTQRIDKAGLIEWKGVDEDVAVYDSNAVGMPIVVPVQSLSAIMPTSLEVLDVPPLTETASGNEVAAYIAAKGYGASWTGARVDISRDGGATYTAGIAITSASVMGGATTVLANFLGGNIFDNSSVVTVTVGSGTLSSATRAQVLDGANAALIGDEIVQFTTATALSAGVYRLTGFLRGRKGTEWAMSTHAAGDRFVLLTTNLRNLPLQTSDAAAGDALVRARSSGSVTGGTTRTVDFQLARLMPYSPVRLGAIKDGSNNWLLDWTRRDRYMNDWNSGVDVPMSEVTELYDVEIESGGVTVASYIDVTTPAQTVPSTVLGSGATSIHFHVWQKSAVVGRGFEAEATITT